MIRTFLYIRIICKNKKYLLPENYTSHANPCHPILFSYEDNMNTQQVEVNEFGEPIECGGGTPS